MLFRILPIFTSLLLAGTLLADNATTLAPESLAALTLEAPATPEGHPLTFQPNSRIARATEVLVGGTSAWQSQPFDDPDDQRFLLFKAGEGADSLRSADRMRLYVQYLDLGKTVVRVDHATSDADGWALGETFRVGDSGEWKTKAITLKGVVFHPEDGGFDIRLRVRGGTDLVVLGVWADPAE